MPPATPFHSCGRKVTTDGASRTSRERGEGLLRISLRALRALCGKVLGLVSLGRIDARYDPGELLFVLQIPLSGNHNSLGLG